jgi:hypothetical protein
MSEKAVIDRFEGNLAVLLIGDGARRLVVRREELPQGAREGHWLQVEVEGEQLLSAALDEAETARTKDRIAEKLARLRRGEHLQG